MPATSTHDVSLAGAGYLLKPGSYRKRSAPLMGSRFTTGDPDYSQLGPIQHWVQSCWIGGMGQVDWSDDAMFDQAVGVDSSLHERLALTRDLATGGTGYALGGTRVEREFAVYQNNLMCLPFNSSGNGILYKYTTSTDTWAAHKTITGALCRTMAPWGRSLFIGSSANYLHRLLDTTLSTVAFPAGVADTVYAMEPFRDRLYVAFGNGNVWRLKPNLTWDGTTVFFDLPDAGYIVDFEVHLGFLYMLSTTGIVYRTDGNNTGEIWRADPGASGKALRSYDGRLFVLLSETDDGGSMSEAAIYQLSGSAMTELKRWGKPAKAVVPSMRMVVLGGRLFYGAGGLLGMQDGFGIAAYDAVEDAHSIFATNKDTTTYPDVSGGGVGWTVDDLIIFGGKLFISVRDYGVFKTPFTFMDYAIGRENATYDVTASSYGDGWLTSSTYDAGTPGLNKLWNSIELDYDLPAAGCGITVDYSIDGGRTWTTGAVTLTYASAGRKRTRTYLTNVRSSSFKWRVRLSSTSTAATPILFAVNVGYLPLQDPQYQWEFSIVVSEYQQLLDNTMATITPATVLGTLEDLYRNLAPFTFIDVDGTTYTTGVIITDFQESIYSTSSSLEGEVRLTLLEVVEA